MFKGDISFAICLLLSKLDPRIRKAVENVRQEVAEQKHGTGEHGDSHDHRVVPVVDGAHAKGSKSRPVEHGFHDERTGHEASEAGADGGDDREQAVFKHLPKQDHAPGKALGDGSHDILLLQLHDGVGADIADKHGHVVHAENDGRQDAVADYVDGACDADGTHAGAGKQLKLHGKYDNQHNPEPEGRDGDTDVGDGAYEIVGQAVLFGSGSQPQGDGDEQGQKKRCPHKPHGGG